MLSHYERFVHPDPDFPLVFHPALTDERVSGGIYLHWHESIELLYLVDGQASIYLNNSPIELEQNDIAVINSGIMHHMPGSPGLRYHCLILDKLFCDSLSVPIQSLSFTPKIQDKQITRLFDEISVEMKQKDMQYKQMVKGYAAQILILLMRRYTQYSQPAVLKEEAKQLRTIKEAIYFIGEHYDQPLNINMLAAEAGFSRYYFCRLFKEVTGQTTIDYINILRCNQARRLIRSGAYNISESARACGFNSMSYFTRTYKKHLGSAPSDDR